LKLLSPADNMGKFLCQILYLIGFLIDISRQLKLSLEVLSHINSVKVVIGPASALRRRLAALRGAQTRGIVVDDVLN
jgi:hypothetical protein